METPEEPPEETGPAEDTADADDLEHGMPEPHTDRADPDNPPEVQSQEDGTNG